MLSSILGSKSRAAILNFFYLNEGKAHHIREVARLLDLNPAQVGNELAKLSELGLFRKEMIGNIHRYSVNPSFQFHKELSSIVRKSAGFEKLITKELARLTGIKFAFIYGSYVNGKFRPKSDIDLMIIGEPDTKELNETITKLETKTKRSIQYVVYPMAEFKEKRSYGFVKNVMQKKKIFITGDEAGIERA